MQFLMVCTLYYLDAGGRDITRRLCNWSFVVDVCVLYRCGKKSAVSNKFGAVLFRVNELDKCGRNEDSTSNESCDVSISNHLQYKADVAVANSELYTSIPTTLLHDIDMSQALSALLALKTGCQNSSVEETRCELPATATVSNQFDDSRTALSSHDSNDSVAASVISNVLTSAEQVMKSIAGHFVLSEVSAAAVQCSAATNSLLLHCRRI
jgi:hypothetical protein